MILETVLTVNKFDVAEKQLHQAINLFFSGGDAISIHTLSEASSQVLYDISKQESDQASLLRDTSWVKAEHKQDWLRALTKARNYFKHADRDTHT